MSNDCICLINFAFMVPRVLLGSHTQKLYRVQADGFLTQDIEHERVC